MLELLSGFGLFAWVILSLIVAFTLAPLRTIGWGGSLLLCIFFTPALGLIGTLLFPLKEEMEMRKKTLKLLQELVDQGKLPEQAAA